VRRCELYFLKEGLCGYHHQPVLSAPIARAFRKRNKSTLDAAMVGRWYRARASHSWSFHPRAIGAASVPKVQHRLPQIRVFVHINDPIGPATR
jgi:hypothetical protein